MFGNRQHVVLVGCTIHGSKGNSGTLFTGECFATVISKHYKDCLLGQSLLSIMRSCFHMIGLHQ